MNFGILIIMKVKKRFRQWGPPAHPLPPGSSISEKPDSMLIECALQRNPPFYFL
jgi:hypothetical protein